MCGGKKKSSIFSMHMCDDAADNLKKAEEARCDAVRDLGKLAGKVEDTSGMMQHMAADLQKVFGKVGDSAASGHMQDAKQFAGDLEKAVKEGKADLKEATGLPKAPKSEAVPEIEALAEKLAAATAQADASATVLKKLLFKATAPDSKDTAKLYYPAMYFVDKEFQDVPQTCGGDAAAEPLLGSIDGCAEACESLGSVKCVGFQYYPSKKGICVLFSKVTSATYYTGCKSEKFLQTEKKPFPAGAVKCMLRFSNFEGTSIKPDKSGKCKGCLKEASKADRCF